MSESERTALWNPPAEDSAEDLYDHAPCGYLSTRHDGVIVKVNETFLRWTGFTREQLIGERRFQELLSVGDRIFYETHYAPLLRMQGSVREIAVDIVCADGRRLPALVNSVLRPGLSGDPDRIRTVVFDATERRQYERELLAARRRAEESETRARLLARTLQASLIPPAPPRVPGLEVGAVYRPAGSGEEVGGDFYDVFDVGDGGWAVVIGDVCGKGAEAAGVTALARYTVRAAAMRSQSPSQVLADLNKALLRQGTERFCTVVYARLSLDGQAPVRLALASGGHPLPLRVSAHGPPEPVGRTGSLLGVLDDPDLEDGHVDLAPGDTVVFFTDGVTEGRRGREFFGEERLDALLIEHRGADAAALAERVVDEVVAFQQGDPRDDIAVVVLRVPES